MNRLIVIAAVAAALAAPGCRFFRRTPKQPPPPPKVFIPPKPVEHEPVELIPPPEVEAQVEISELPGLPGPSYPPAPRRRVPRPRQQAGEVATNEPEPVQPPSPPQVPQLGQILSAEEQQTYNATIDRNLDRAQKIVISLSGKRLNRDQVMYFERVRTFIQQAGEARKTDLVSAASLAERAAVLAEDLAKSVP